MTGVSGPVCTARGQNFTQQTPAPATPQRVIACETGLCHFFLWLLNVKRVRRWHSSTLCSVWNKQSLKEKENPHRSNHLMLMSVLLHSSCLKATGKNALNLFIGHLLPAAVRQIHIKAHPSAESVKCLLLNTLKIMSYSSHVFVLFVCLFILFCTR